MKTKFTLLAPSTIDVGETKIKTSRGTTFTIHAKEVNGEGVFGMYVFDKDDRLVFVDIENIDKSLLTSTHKLKELPEELRDVSDDVFKLLYSRQTTKYKLPGVVNEVVMLVVSSVQFKDNSLPILILASSLSKGGLEEIKSSSSDVAIQTRKYLDFLDIDTSSCLEYMRDRLTTLYRY